MTWRSVLPLVGLAACGKAHATPPAPKSEPVPIASASATPSVALPTEAICPADYTCDIGSLERTPAPKITSLLVERHAHKLHLVAGKTIVRSYGVAIGGGGFGQKRVEGDQITPMGTYAIVGKMPSRWHTYLALDYPNAEDRRRYADLVAKGEVDPKKGPGSAIAIHGRRANMPDKLHKLVDWTLGCIALDNDEIDQVAAVTPVGTRVVIRD